MATLLSGRGDKEKTDRLETIGRTISVCISASLFLFVAFFVYNDLIELSF